MSQNTQHNRQGLERILRAIFWQMPIFKTNMHLLVATLVISQYPVFPLLPLFQWQYLLLHLPVSISLNPLCFPLNAKIKETKCLLTCLYSPLVTLKTGIIVVTFTCLGCLAFGRKKNKYICIFFYVILNYSLLIQN